MFPFKTLSHANILNIFGKFREQTPISFPQKKNSDSRCLRSFFFLLVCVYFVFHKVERDTYSYDIHIFILMCSLQTDQISYIREDGTSITVLPKSGFEIQKYCLTHSKILLLKYLNVKKNTYFLREPERSLKSYIFQSGDIYHWCQSNTIKLCGSIR